MLRVLNHIPPGTGQAAPRVKFAIRPIGIGGPYRPPSEDTIRARDVWPGREDVR